MFVTSCDCQLDASVCNLPQPDSFLCAEYHEPGSLTAGKKVWIGTETGTDREQFRTVSKPELQTGLDLDPTKKSSTHTFLDPFEGYSWDVPGVSYIFFSIV